MTKNLKIMTEAVNQDNLESQRQYFDHLNITTWKGRLYRKYYLYPRLNLNLKGKTLDIGCGLGSFLKSRKGSVGVDINPFCVDYCNENGLEAFLCNKTPYPFGDHTFDSVVFDNVIEHMDDPSEILEEIFRVLRPDGRLMIGVPTITGYKSQADHRVFYNESDLKELATKYKFSFLKSFYTPVKSNYLENTMNAHCLYAIFNKT
jgi:SAM-dependent methyltransferase